MTGQDKSVLHDGYADGYDSDVIAYDCHVADLLFGLCYQYIQPRERLLDVGIGSGLSSQPFWKAGLEIHGMDFSSAMLDKCRAKGFDVDLCRYDLEQTPWPYDASTFDHVICCGVLHFIQELRVIFREVGRVLIAGGTFAFTTRDPTLASSCHPYERYISGGFEIFSHSREHIRASMADYRFAHRKQQRCYIGEDLFSLWVAEKQ